jgi:TonB family protein
MLNTIIIPSAIMTFTAFAAMAAGGTVETPLDDTDRPVYHGASGLSSSLDSMNAVDSAPKIIRGMSAEYPDSLAARGIEGPILCDLLVSEKGTVDSAAIVRGLRPELDSSALRAVRTFVFSPALLHGNPVPVLLRYEYRFSLPVKRTAVAEIKNLIGDVVEKGTRAPVARATIAVSFEDTIPPKKHPKKFVCVEKKPEGTPLAEFLREIGKLKGQQLEDGSITTRSDSAGGFSFSSLPCGTIRLKVVAAGCKPFSTSFVIEKGKALKTRLWLERESYSRDEIVVYGNVPQEQVQSHAVDLPEMRSVAGFNSEAIKLIQSMPGVARPVFGGNELVIRGSDNTDSRVFIDGIEMPYLYHPLSYDFMMYRGVVNTDVLSSVSLFPGGWGVEHGNAIGGIIDMQTRSARRDRWHGALDVNIKGLNALFETPLGPNAGVIGSFRGNFLFDEIGFVKRHVFGEKTMDMRDFWDYSLRLDWKVAPRHRVEFSVIGARDTMYSFDPSWMKSVKHDPSREMQSAGINMNIGIAAWTWSLSPKAENILRYGIMASSDKNFNNMSEEFQYEKGARTLRHYLREELRLKINDRISAKAGLDVRREPYDDSATVWLKDTTFAGRSKTLFGPIAGYALCEWKPVDKLTVTPGLRYDYYTQLGYHGSWLPEFWNYGEKGINNHTRFSGDPSVRVSGRYAFDQKRALIASVGNYNQSPDSMIIMTGLNKNLVSEKGSQIALGYEWKKNDVISVDCQGYAGRQWDKARFMTAEENASDPGKWIAADGKARMEGIELMLRHGRTDRFFGWLSYSLAYSERFDYGQNKWVEYDYNILNNLQLVANWFFGRNMGFGLRFQYTEGYPYTPMDVGYYDADYFQYMASARATNSKRHPAYFGLDLRYEKKWVFKHSMLTGYVEGERLIHLLQYVKNSRGEPVYHPGEFNQYNYDYSSFQSMPMFPMGSLGFTWEF